MNKYINAINFAEGWLFGCGSSNKGGKRVICVFRPMPLWAPADADGRPFGSVKIRNETSLRPIPQITRHHNALSKIKTALTN
jgi:hypothetical protein